MSKPTVIRKERVPLHRQNIFVAETREGYQRMWIPDVPLEINKYQLAGWEIVQQEMKTHDNLLQVESQFDSVVRRVVNKDPLAPYKTCVLVEIPLEFYEQDCSEMEKLLKEQEQNYKKKGKNEYGDVSIS